MNCQACGSAINEELPKFCPKCGKPIQGLSVPFWKRPVSREIGGSIILLLLIFGWLGFVQDVKHSQKIPTFMISGFFFWFGILGAVLAPRRKWLWFFLGMLLSIPIMLLAGVVGGVLR